MGKLMDYIRWRGDLSFSQDPANVIDTLILALLSYLPFTDVVPGIESNEEISLKNAANQYFSQLSTAADKSASTPATASGSYNTEVEALFKKVASCPRYEEIRLSRYVENTDFVVERQFAALTSTLPDPDRTIVIAFRGTDNSIVGWKEDFKLSYLQQIPAQQSAYEYLEGTVCMGSSQLIVCGHSKGGNLAMYAGSHLSAAYQSGLMKIVNFDGPGFDFSIVQQDPFLQYQHKIFNYVPVESMVGLLLDSTGERTVVASTATFVHQHNALNWEIEGAKFVRGNLSNKASMLEHTLKTWLPEISISDRAMFIEALFEIIGASDGTITKLGTQENLQEIRDRINRYSKLDKKSRALLAQIFESFSSEARKTLSATVVVKLPLSERNPSTS